MAKLYWWIGRLNAEQGNIWRAADYAADTADVPEGKLSSVRKGLSKALRWLLGLKRVPHYTTFQKASRRLLKAVRARRLFRTTIGRFLGRRRRLRRVALDSTGLECGHRSLYYVRRRHGLVIGEGNAERMLTSSTANDEDARHRVSARPA